MRIEHHPENGIAPWVLKIGKNKTIWIAYMSLWKALYKLPILAWKFRNVE